MDVLVIGQSNAGNWFHDVTFSASAPNTLSWRGGGWHPVRGEGAVTFANTLAASGQSVRLLNAAEGNTSLTPVQSANWLASGPDSLYGKMLAAVAAAGFKPDAIIWIQGERDAQFRVGTEAYRAGLETLYERLTADFGDVPLLMQPLVLPQSGKDEIVAAQQAFAAAHANVTLVTPTMELMTRDLLHFTPAGYNVLGEFMARAVLAEFSLPAATPITQGTSSSDTLAGNESANRIYAGAGSDNVVAHGGNDVLLGEQGNDRMNGGAGADVISGGSGDDTIVGGAGADLLVGDTGADHFVFSGAAEGDRITDFTTGVDKLVFDTGQITFSGSSVYQNGQLVVTVQGTVAAGDIVIEMAPPPPPPPPPPAPPPPPPANLHRVGTARADTLIGGDGNDTLDGGAGRDSLVGGMGDDTYIVTSGDRLSDTGGIDHVVSNGSWTLGAGLEHLTLVGTANMTGVGNALDNRIVGNAGNNTLVGGGGNDTFDGGAGSDTVDYGPGATHGALIDLTVLANIEHARGTAFDDRIVGNAANNTLFGGNGNDIFVASAGRDMLDGGSGFDTVDYSGGAGVVVTLGSLRNIEGAVGSASADRITGTAASNRLDGGAGNDTVVGGRGNDTLIGGAGSDAFEFRELVTRAGPDRIVDFTPGVDKIWLDDAGHSRIGLRGNFADNDVRFWAAPGATRGHDANDRVIYDVSTGNLYYDADGSGRGAAVLIATLEGAPSISAADFAVM